MKLFLLRDMEYCLIDATLLSLSEGLFEMIVGILTTCHILKEIGVFFFNRTTLQVFVTYLTDAVYVHPL